MARSYGHAPGLNPGSTIFIDLGRLPGTESRHGDEKRAQMHSSSNSLGTIVGVVFMRVNSKCAHQVRPPLRQEDGSGRTLESDNLIGYRLIR